MPRGAVVINRPLAIVAGFLLALVPLPAAAPQDPPKAPAIERSGSVEDLKLAEEVAQCGVVVSAAESEKVVVIVSPKGWERLVKAWDVKDAPKVDFAKHLLVVATTRGGMLDLRTRLDDRGDLRVLALATRDRQPGFRYAIKSAGREGLKTVNGKELPKE
jgi:hypothetical protein